MPGPTDIRRGHRFPGHAGAVFAAVEDELALGIGPLHIGAMYSSAYQQRYGISDEDLAAVVVKARANAQSNPYAHLRDPITVEEVLGSPVIASPIRPGDGLSGVIVGSRTARHKR